MTQILRLCFRWRGEGLDEVGYDEATGAVRVTVDPRYFRPAEVVSRSVKLSRKNCCQVQD